MKKKTVEIPAVIVRSQEWDSGDSILVGNDLVRIEKMERDKITVYKAKTYKKKKRKKRNERKAG